jgi:DNA-binding NarL/FixJ family response regulator
MADRLPRRRTGILLFKIPELQRESLREFIAPHQDLELLADLSSTEELESFAAGTTPDVVMISALDHDTDKLCRVMPDTRVVQITPDGRRAIVGRQVSTDDIVNAIRSLQSDSDRSET